MFQDSSSPSIHNNDRKPTELLEHKSEISYFVPPTTQVSHEPSSSISSRTENPRDEDEDLLHSSITTEPTVLEKKQPENILKIQEDEQIIPVKFDFNLFHTKV
jgi:hypothetical protein